MHARTHIRVHRQTCTNNNCTHTHPHNNRRTEVTTVTNANPITYQEWQVHKQSNLTGHANTKAMHGHITRTTLITQTQTAHSNTYATDTQIWKVNTPHTQTRITQECVFFVYRRTFISTEIVHVMWQWVSEWESVGF